MKQHIECSVSISAQSRAEAKSALLTALNAADTASYICMAGAILMLITAMQFGAMERISACALACVAWYVYRKTRILRQWHAAAVRIKTEESNES